MRYRRFRRRPLPAALVLLLLVLLAAVRLWQEQEQARPRSAPRIARVERVVDGDTLLIEDGVRVRLIGVDTPESVKPAEAPEPLGPEASDFTRRLVDGRNVRLEFDRQRTDRYGRTLAFVYLGDLMLNEELIRQGYSRAETRFPFRADYKRRFLAAEAEARKAGRGIWSLPPAAARP